MSSENYCYYDYSKALKNLTYITPFSILVSGCSRSGKTTWVIDLLSYPENHLSSGIPESVIWIHGTEYQGKYDRLREFLKNKCEVHFLKISSDMNLSTEDLGMKPGCVIVFDDVMQIGLKNPFICQIFTEGVHHGDYSCIFIVQKFFQNSDLFRIIKDNSNYWVLFKNPKNIKQISQIAQLAFSKGEHGFVLDAFKQATKDLHSNLVFNFYPSTPEEERLATSTLKTEKGPLIIYRPTSGYVKTC